MANYVSGHTGEAIEKNLNKVDSIGYGICTDSASPYKVTIDNNRNFNLTAGAQLTVTFTNTVTAGASLNVNGTGAKPIYNKGASITANVIKANRTVVLVYDGSNYNLTSAGVDISVDEANGILNIG